MGDVQEADYMSVAVEEPGKKAPTTTNNTNLKNSSSTIRAHGVKCVKRRTTLEKLLIFFLFIVLLLVILLIIGLVIQSTKGPDLCLSKHCVATAGALLDNMDPEVDPCEDFYQYSCGGWMKRTVIPEDKSVVTILNQLQDRLLVLSRGLLEDGTTHNGTDAESKVKNLYEACIDEESIEERDVAPLLAFVDELGGWPLVSDVFDEDAWVLADVLANIRRSNDKNYLFEQKMEVDIKNSTRNLILIDQPYSLGMKSRDYFLRDRDDKIVQAYLTYMVNMVKELRPDLSEADIREDVDAVYNFERDIANSSAPREERKNLLEIYKKVTIAQLGDMAPGLDWLRYFQLVFEDEAISERDELYTFAMPYVVKIADIVHRTPKRVIANFFMWRVTMNSVEQLSSRLRRHWLQYRRVVEGETMDEARWSSCVMRCNLHMGDALGIMFIREHFDERSKTEAKEMVQGIRYALLEVLDNTDWMDDVTKQQAIEKAHAIYEMIGYMEEIKDTEARNLAYENVNITQDKHFENIVELLKNRARQMVSQRVRSLLEDSLDPPVRVNAFFQQQYNRIYFPAGILQPPFYSRHNLKSMNYGGIGMVIGHELTHGFDDKGRLFDKHGTLREWFSPESVAAFDEKKQCLIDQYSNFSDVIDGERIYLNGLLSIGENMADNGGLKDSFMAYREWVKQQGHEEQLLPGLGLNNNQLFFLNFGQIWCSMYRPQHLKDALRNSPHPPQHFRVLGSVINSLDFAEAFQCPVGSPMNPAKKCRVW